MNKKVILVKLMNTIKNNGLLTKFLNTVFEYNNLSDFSYIYRLTNKADRVVIDIYDNISNNRFNRYIFLFNDLKYDKRVVEENNVFVTYINVLKYKDNNNNFDKLIYLINLDKQEMIMYANTFLDKEFIEILNDIIK